MILQPLVSNVREYVELHLPQYVEELYKLCSIDSESYYKIGLDEIIKVLSARMWDLGIKITVFEREQWGDDLLGGIHGEGSGNVVLLGHIDTAYPVGTAKARPVRVERGKIYGPGVSAMKGGILAAIYAIEALLAQDYHSFGEIRFLCVSDKKINNRHSESLIHEVLRDCQLALVLEAALENGDIISARQGIVRYKLSARGRAAYAGVDSEKGYNAIVELAHQILQFHSLNGLSEGLTISPYLTSGGRTAANREPDFAEVFFDVRFLQYEDQISIEDRWFSMMRQKLLPSVELSLERLPNPEKPMASMSESMELVLLAQRLAGALSFSLNHTIKAGASDASYASQLGVPVLDGLGPIGGFDPGFDEYLMLDSVAPRTALLAGLIASVGAQKAYL